MAEKPPSEAVVESWWKAVGVESLCQWDVLLFLERHQASLVGAEYIARLLGYTTAAIVVALDVLETVGFVERSRVSQNIRLYQFIVPFEPSRRDAFERLRTLGDDRRGRLRLAGHLRGGDRSPPQALAAPPRFGGKLQPAVRSKPLRSGPGPAGRNTWPKAM